MLHRVESSDSRFKAIDFTAGPNCVLAERTEGSSEVDTRNGAGKSSIIEIISYLLGANRDRDSIFQLDDVGDFWYGLTIDIGDEPKHARRTPTKSTRVYVDTNEVVMGVRTERDRDLNQYFISNEEWKQVLGGALFGIEPNDAAAPTFRQAIAFFLRREQQGGYRKANRYADEVTDVDAVLALAYLVGLDYRLVDAWRKLKVDERDLRELKKAVKGGVMSSIIESSARLRPKMLDAERRTAELRRQISDFRVLEAYREIVAETTVLKQRLEELAREILVDQQRIQRIDATLSSEKPPSFEDMQSLYADASVTFPELVKRSYEEYVRFHNSIVANRRAHLQRELREAQDRIDLRSRQAAQIDDERSRELGLLRTHGALEDFVNLQERLAQIEATYQDYRRRYEAALAFEQTAVKLRERRAELVRTMFESLNERRDVIEVLTRDFSELVSEFYGDRQASLEISVSDKGLQIEATIQGDRSPGISGIEIFCFDMVLMRAVRRRKLGIDWLVHDSHLFSDSDQRHVAKALSVGARESSRWNFQYIVMLNTDQLTDTREYVEREEYHVAQELTDTPHGGLFGRRF